MDFIHIAQFLTKLPEDITSEKLFSCIAAIQMQNSNKKWTQVSGNPLKWKKSPTNILKMFSAPLLPNLYFKKNVCIYCFLFFLNQ